MKTWPKVKLGEVILQIRGVSYTPQNASETPKDKYIPILRAHNIQDDGLDFAKLVYVDSSKVSERQYLQKGDIVICASSGSKGLVGKAARFEGSGAFSFGAFCKAARPCGVNSRYLAHFFAGKSYRRKISDLSAGANINNIKNEHIDRLEIPLPPIAEQERVAAELDAVVATLKKRRTQLAELDALAQARFVELFDGGRFPTVAIGEEFKTTSGGTPSSKTREFYDGGAIPWLNSGEVNREIVDYAENFITELGLKNSSAKWVPVDSVLVAMYGATVGKVGLLRIPATTNQAVCSILPNPRYCARYLYFAVKSQERWMRAQALGGAQPNISQTVIKKMTIPKPPLELQERFAAEVERVETIKAKVRDGIAETQTLFDALTQHYFG